MAQVNANGGMNETVISLWPMPFAAQCSEGFFHAPAGAQRNDGKVVRAVWTCLAVAGGWHGLPVGFLSRLCWDFLIGVEEC